MCTNLLLKESLDVRLPPVFLDGLGLHHKAVVLGTQQVHQTRGLRRRFPLATVIVLWQTWSQSYTKSGSIFFSFCRDCSVKYSQKCTKFFGVLLSDLDLGPLTECCCKPGSWATDRVLLSDLGLGPLMECCCQTWVLGH